MEKIEVAKHSFAWSGKIPNTGTYRCVHCGQDGDDVNDVNDAYEWTLIDKNKKTIVRCETNPYKSMGLVSTDSLVCKIYDYDKDEKIRTSLAEKIKHETPA